MYPHYIPPTAIGEILTIQSNDELDMNSMQAASNAARLTWESLMANKHYGDMLNLQEERFLAQIRSAQNPEGVYVNKFEATKAMWLHLSSICNFPLITRKNGYISPPSRIYNYKKIAARWNEIQDYATKHSVSVVSTNTALKFLTGIDKGLTPQQLFERSPEDLQPASASYEPPQQQPDASAQVVELQKRIQELESALEYERAKNRQSKPPLKTFTPKSELTKKALAGTL